ncbi:MAG TPA: TIM barrel protein [Candidatus Saccharimonadales bacterium]|nr:TIM barrel protein [Candidatus Saccharimonadales bacterium]
MNVTLGINTCFALKRWPRPADWAALVRNDLGLDFVELSLDLIEGTDTFAGRRDAIERTRAALDAYGLHARATFTGLAAYALDLLMHPDATRREGAMVWYRDVIDLTAALGCNATGGHVGAMSVPDWSDPERRAERWETLKRDLNTLAEHARNAGLDYLLVENLVAVREPSMMAQIEDLLTEGDADHVPWRLCLDVGHQCVPGTTGDERDPYAWIQRFGSRLAEVQLQQSDGLADHHWAFTAEHNAGGIIDAERVLTTLSASGAGDVDLVFEIIPGWEDPDGRVVDDLRSSVEMWKAAIRAHPSKG